MSTTLAILIVASLVVQAVLGYCIGRLVERCGWWPLIFGPFYRPRADVSTPKDATPRETT